MPFGRRAAPPSLKMETPRVRDANTQGTRTISSSLLSARSVESFGYLRGLSRGVGGRLRRLRLPSHDGQRG
jgi:hypothetical protein